MARRRKLILTIAVSAIAAGTLLTQELPKKYDVAEEEARLVAQLAPIDQQNLNDAPVVARNDQSPAGSPTTASNTGTAAPAAAPKPTPSQNVTINLIHRLVERGVLTQADADELIKQAEDDAARARALAAQQQQQQRTAAVREEENAPQLFAEPSPLPQSSANVSAVPPPPAENAGSNDEGDAVNVTYVPDVVKQQLREEIKQDVMEQAREENWANPRIFPTWLSRFTPFFDLRLRYRGDYFPSGNDDSGAFPNFNAINTGPPFDVTGTTFSPQLNVDQNRNRAQIRVRGGVALNLDDGFTMGIRIATGETNTPTSTNQTLGVANNAQGGDFSKYQIWLDKAFLRYEISGGPNEDFMAEVGRFDNPFFTVSELMWDEDLGWDGLAIAGRHEVAKGVIPFAAAGIFPVFNTSFNFSTNRPDKFSSEDKWLYGGQLGTEVRISKDFTTKVAGGFWDFYNIEGKLSDPFVPLTASDQGDTDESRPSFAQKGNTYFPIRDIIPTADNGFGTNKQFQYFGYATPFRVAEALGTLDFSHFDPVHITLYGQWIQNLAFDFSDVNAIAINNRGPNRPNGKPGNFDGGNTGWIAGVKIGHSALEKAWDWNAGVNYRYLESDATPDAFNDSDFGGGGTNVKGYTVFGNLAITPRIWMTLRWMSANEVGGPTFRQDVLLIDLNAKF
jgi:hypothetical protein